MPGFDLNKKIIGRGGQCTKGIFTATGAKIRLRGQGSGFKESQGSRGELREASVPLMLAITSGQGDHENFQRAVRMATELLQGISDRFAEFCKKRGEPAQPAQPPNAA